MKVVTYFRVSTAAQGRLGLGLEAQRGAVDRDCRGRAFEVLAEFVEVESGKKNDRPKLIEALRLTKVTGLTQDHLAAPSGTPDAPKAGGTNKERNILRRRRADRISRQAERSQIRTRRVRLCVSVVIWFRG